MAGRRGLSMKKRILLLAVLLVFVFATAQYGTEPVIGDLHTIQFNSQTTNGAKIDSSIFQDNKITMMNVWATNCNACVKEMPALQSLYEKYKDQGVNIIGVVADATNTDKIELANKIIQGSGVTFDNIVADDMLQNGLLQNVDAFPTTIFVDSDGNIVGKTIVGASTRAYEKEIKRLLQ